MPLSLAAITYLPVDLARWDHGPGGDVLVVPVWTDVRPLRGATGLLDWRLCGRLSQMIREGHLQGQEREKLLFLSNRTPWERILVIGVGETGQFSEEVFSDTALCILTALDGIGASSAAIVLPGRDVDLIPSDRALRGLLSILEKSHPETEFGLKKLTIIDVPAAIKTMNDAIRDLLPH